MNQMMRWAWRIWLLGFIDSTCPCNIYTACLILQTCSMLSVWALSCGPQVHHPAAGVFSDDEVSGGSASRPGSPSGASAAGSSGSSDSGTGYSESSSSSSSSSAEDSGSNHMGLDDAPPPEPLRRRRPREAGPEADPGPPGVRLRRDETFEWRGFRFTFQPAHAGGRSSYMALCRYHSRTCNATKCTRTAGWTEDADRAQVILRLPSWCVRAADFDFNGNEPDRVGHQAHDRRGLTILSHEELEAIELPELPQ